MLLNTGPRKLSIISIPLRQDQQEKHEFERGNQPKLNSNRRRAEEGNKTQPPTAAPNTTKAITSSEETKTWITLASAAL